MSEQLYQTIMDIVSLSAEDTQDIFKRLAKDFPERAAEIQSALWVAGL